MKSEIETLKQLLAEEKQKNTPLKAALDWCEKQLRDPDVRVAAAVETERERCRAALVAFRDKHEHTPGGGAVWNTLNLAIAALSPSEAPSSGSDKGASVNSEARIHECVEDSCVLRGQRVHDLKCWPHFFEAQESGRKHFEVRRADRNFQTGDVLKLREWDPARSFYTERCLWRRVTYILRADGANGIKEGFLVMGTERLIGGIP